MTTIDATVAQLMGRVNLLVNAESQLASGPLIWGKVYEEKKVPIFKMHSDLEAALRAALTEAQPTIPIDLSERLAELHLYEEIAVHYELSEISPGALRDWIADRASIAQPVPPAPVACSNQQKVYFIKGWDACRAYEGLPCNVQSDAALHRVMPLTSPPTAQPVPLAAVMSDWVKDAEVQAAVNLFGADASPRNRRDMRKVLESFAASRAQPVEPSQALEFFRAGCKECDRQKQAYADNKEWQESVMRGNEIVSAMARVAINAKE